MGGRFKEKFSFKNSKMEGVINTALYAVVFLLPISYVSTTLDNNLNHQNSPAY